MTITPYKKTGNVTHTFEYNSVPITNRTLYIDTLTFDEEVNIIDTAAVNFVGTVSIATTAPFNGGFPCPISNVTVCIKNYIGGESFACTNTDNDGMLAKQNKAQKQPKSMIVWLVIADHRYPSLNTHVVSYIVTTMHIRACR